MMTHSTDAAILRNQPRMHLMPTVPVASSLGHRLINGDALVQDTIAPESVDLIITSPPYNVGKAYTGDEYDDAMSYEEYIEFTRCWLKNCYIWTMPTGRLCVNVSLDKNKNGKQPLSSDVTRLAIEVGWKYHATIIWDEGNISRNTAWGSWMSASAPHVIAPVETIIVLYKDEWKRERQGESDILSDEFNSWVRGTWSFSGENSKQIGHEAPFPRELPKRCIKLFSFLGDTVLDPFAGSGTTMIEAAENERWAIGIEKEFKYCELTLKRLQDECELTLEPTSEERQGTSANLQWIGKREPLADSEKSSGMRTQIGSILSGKTESIYRSVLDKVDSYSTPHEFVTQAYGQYQRDHGSNASVNGRMFQFIICETLMREGIVPFYHNAEFAHVPQAAFDLVCYHPKRPVVLSVKVSLRERYKQAALEGLALSDVYRNAKSYLLTLSDEQARIQKRIKSGDVAGLTDCIRADTSDYTAFLEELKRDAFSPADRIAPIIKGKLIR